ncbi:MAG: phosphoadenylyl-sulfate reductase [Clostridiaceae bacterium]|nr:phosphoadenylyl-sulfate reductase [Clostridiaceae bacterium]
MDRNEIKLLNEQFKDKTAQEIIDFAIDKFGLSKIILATSLSIEDQVLTDIFVKANKDCRLFFIDTGRHFQSTYDLLQNTAELYNVSFEIYAPDNKDLEVMVHEHGPNLFYESIDLRKKCCEIRKVIPLKRVLKTVDAWVCGLRREQSPTRDELNVFEWDAGNEIMKVNPLAFWDEQKVWEYIKKENIPYNRLYKENFRSIGCQPCTRAVKDGENVRDGRWWWENPDRKECGLHTGKRNTTA